MADLLKDAPNPFKLNGILSLLKAVIYSFIGVIFFVALLDGNFLSLDGVLASLGSLLVTVAAGFATLRSAAAGWRDYHSFRPSPNDPIDLSLRGGDTPQRSGAAHVGEAPGYDHHELNVVISDGNLDSLPSPPSIFEKLFGKHVRANPSVGYLCERMLRAALITLTIAMSLGLILWFAAGHEDSPSATIVGSSAVLASFVYLYRQWSPRRILRQRTKPIKYIELIALFAGALAILVAGPRIVPTTDSLIGYVPFNIVVSDYVLPLIVTLILITAICILTVRAIRDCITLSEDERQRVLSGEELERFQQPHTARFILGHVATEMYSAADPEATQRILVKNVRKSGLPDSDAAPDGAFMLAETATHWAPLQRSISANVLVIFGHVIGFAGFVWLLIALGDLSPPKTLSASAILLSTLGPTVYLIIVLTRFGQMATAIGRMLNSEFVFHSTLVRIEIEALASSGPTAVFSRGQADEQSPIVVDVAMSAKAMQLTSSVLAGAGTGRRSSLSAPRFVIGAHRGSTLPDHIIESARRLIDGEDDRGILPWRALDLAARERRDAQPKLIEPNEGGDPDGYDEDQDDDQQGLAFR